MIKNIFFSIQRFNNLFNYYLREKPLGLDFSMRDLSLIKDPQYNYKTKWEVPTWAPKMQEGLGWIAPLAIWRNLPSSHAITPQPVLRNPGSMPRIRISCVA